MRSNVDARGNSRDKVRLSEVGPDAGHELPSV